MFEFDDKQIKQYEKDLKAFASRAYPFATKATINRAAFETRSRGQENIGRQMVLRNKFAQASVRVEQARTLSVPMQAAHVGSVADFMERQEFGGIETSSGRYQPIATAYAAGQGRNVRPRTKLPRRPNRLRNIRLTRRERNAKTRGQAVVLAAQEAVESGRRYIFLDLGQKQGVFKVVGGRKGTKRGWPKGAKLQMVWDMTNRAVRTPRNPWLLPATRETQRHLGQYYAEAALFQLRRAGVFGYRS